MTCTLPISFSKIRKIFDGVFIRRTKMQHSIEIDEILDGAENAKAILDPDGGWMVIIYYEITFAAIHRKTTATGSEWWLSVYYREDQ